MERTKEEIINDLMANVYLNGDNIIAHTLYKLGEIINSEFDNDHSPNSIYERIETELNISKTEYDERKEEFRRRLK